MQLELFNKSETIYTPFKGYLVFEGEGKLFKLKIQRIKNKSNYSFRVKDKKGKTYKKNSIKSIERLLELTPSRFLLEELPSFKMKERSGGVIVVESENEEQFVFVWSESSLNRNINYEIFPKGISEKYPLLKEFERNRYTSYRCAFRSLKYYLSLCLERENEISSL